MHEPITSVTASRLQRVARMTIAPTYDAVWMPDGVTFAAALENGVWLLDTMQEHKPRRVIGDKDVAAIACDPRGSLLALGGWLTVHVIDSLTGARKAEFSINEGIEIRHLTFSPDGRWLASSADGSVVVADLSSARAQRLPGGSGGPAAWSGDGRILAYPTFEKGADGAIELWDRETETVQRSIEVDVITLEALACSPAAPLLVGGFTTGDVRVWDIATGAEQMVLRQEDWVVDAAFSPDGSLLAVLGEKNCTTRLWDMRTGQLCATLPTGLGYRVLFSPAGSQIAVVNGHEGISVWGL